MKKERITIVIIGMLLILIIVVLNGIPIVRSWVSSEHVNQMFPESLSAFVDYMNNNIPSEVRFNGIRSNNNEDGNIAYDLNYSNIDSLNTANYILSLIVNYTNENVDCPINNCCYEVIMTSSMSPYGQVIDATNTVSSNDSITCISIDAHFVPEYIEGDCVLDEVETIVITEGDLNDLQIAVLNRLYPNAEVVQVARISGNIYN